MESYFTCRGCAPPPSACQSRSGTPDWDDPVLRTAWRRTDGAVFRREPGGGFSLTYPYLPTRPFPLVPLFCLAQTVCLEGQIHLVFTFDAAGTPIVPQAP